MTPAIVVWKDVAMLLIGFIIGYIIKWISQQE